MARRANGEGTIFKRADGRWSGEISYRDVDGRTKRRTVYARTQAEVRGKLDSIRERIEAGAPVKDTTMTLAAWLDDWTTKALPASDRKQATVDLYATIARKHLVPALGNRLSTGSAPRTSRYSSWPNGGPVSRHPPCGRSTPSCAVPWTSPSGTDC